MEGSTTSPIEFVGADIESSLCCQNVSNLTSDHGSMGSQPEAPLQPFSQPLKTLMVVCSFSTSSLEASVCGCLPESDGAAAVLRSFEWAPAPLLTIEPFLPCSLGFVWEGSVNGNKGEGRFNLLIEPFYSLQTM